MSKKIIQALPLPATIVSVAVAAIIFIFSAVQADQEGPAVNKSFTEEFTLFFTPPENAQVYFESSVSNYDLTCFAFVLAFEKGRQVVSYEKGRQVSWSKTLGRLYDHIARGYPVLAPGTDTVGYLAERDGKLHAVIGDRESPPFDGVCCLRFSPDGEYSAYIAQNEGRQFVVMNGRQLKRYEMIDQQTGILFSPDSVQAAYIAVKDGRQMVVHNGREQPPFDNITEISFSPDSSQLAYIAVKDQDYYIMRQGRPIGPFDNAQALAWSPDGSFLTAVAVNSDQWIIIKNDRRIPAGEYAIRTFFNPQTNEYGYSVPRLTPPAISPDSNRFAYARMDEGKFRVVVDDKDGPALDQAGTVFFSPDSKRFAYIGTRTNTAGDRSFIVVDGEPGRDYDQVSRPFFSPDGRRLAYQARKGDRQCIVVDHKEGPWYDQVSTPYFSPDSSTLVYRAKKGKNFHVVENGREHPPYDQIAHLLFSPDSSQLAYKAQKGDAWLVVRNGQEGRHYKIIPPEHLRMITNPFFSPGNHLIYTVRSADSPYESKIVVNEQEGGQTFIYLIETPPVCNETHCYLIISKIEDDTPRGYRLDIKISDELSSPDALQYIKTREEE